MLKEDMTSFPGIEFDAAFVEEAVFLAVRYNDKKIDDSIIENFHNNRERIYQDLTTENRNESFERLYKEYFNKLGIKEIFKKIVMDFPLLHQPNISLFIKKVWSKIEEDTDLYVDGDLKTVYIALTANRILQPFCMQAVLRHELLRISDMLDPKFQYLPHINLGRKNELENNLIRDRFRILWDAYIDIRLRKNGQAVIKSLEERKKEFEKIFLFLNANEREYIYSKLEGCDSLRHADLLDWAQDARSIKTLSEGGLRCPLCDFTCYHSIKDWPKETIGVAEEIKKNNPDWQPSLGVCLQCFEIYQSRMGMVK